MIPTARRDLILAVVSASLAGTWTVAAFLISPNLSRLEAGLIAIALSAAFGWMLGRWNGGLDTLQSRESKRLAWATDIALVVLASAFLAVTVWTGAVHDYAEYLHHWSVILQGRNPYFVEHGYWGDQPSNPYGPLFNVLAALAAVNTLGPKLLFAATHVVAATILAKRLTAHREASFFTVLGVIIWAWNPFAWVEVAIRGHFDVLVGAASVVAVHARRRDRDVLCGAALAVGVLLKYIPLVLLPFLVLDHGRIRGRLVATSAVLIAAGLGLSCLVWGPSTLSALGFAANRSATYLSIFRFLGGRYSPLHLAGVEGNVDALALPALAVALSGAWFWCRARRTDPATSALLAALITLLLYRNGFPQYQMVLFMLASYWVAATWGQRRHRTALAIALIGYFGWIIAFDVMYCLIGDGWPRFEDAVGLPTFVLGAALVACVAWSEPEPQQAEPSAS